MRIEQYIKHIRKMNNYTIEEIAQRINLAPITVRNIESGTTRLHLETAMKLSKVIGFSLDDMANECIDEIK